MHFFVSAFALLITLLAVTPAGATAPFKAGSPQADIVTFQLAIYFPAKPKADPLMLMRTVAAKEFPAFQVVDKPSGSPTRMLLNGIVERNVKQNYAVPDMEALKYFGRGLTKAQELSLQASEQALLLNFAHPKTHTLEALRAAYVLAEKLARTTDGFIWDEETRQVFTPDRWHAERLETWATGVPSITRHIAIHSYQKGDLIRGITLGMSKFGLPDIVVERFPSSSTSHVGNLINLLAQSLAEGGPIGAGGQVTLDIRSIKHKEVREQNLPEANAKVRGAAMLALVDGTPDEGDPRNRLIEISASRYPGPDSMARQAALLTDLFGVIDAKIIDVSHDDKLDAASRQARAKLPALRAAFNQGLRPGEYISLKAPFATTSGSNEYMWVEVTAWSGNAITGILNNTPRDVPGLKAGQIVKVDEDTIFDYLRTFPDGQQDGNTTSAIIVEMQRGQSR